MQAFNEAKKARNPENDHLHTIRESLVVICQTVGLEYIKIVLNPQVPTCTCTAFKIKQVVMTHVILLEEKKLLKPSWAELEGKQISNAVNHTSASQPNSLPSNWFRCPLFHKDCPDL